MRITVTGGAGFIGSTLVDRLLADGHRVDVVDNLSTGRPGNLGAARGLHGDRLGFHEADITDPGITGLIAGLSPEVVIHLAAQIDVRLSVADPVADALTNVVGTLRVLDGARSGGARKVVFTSSGGAVHGSIRPGEPPASESSPRRPESPYGVSKMVILDYLPVYRDLYGLDFTALAPANVYGPRQDAYGEGGVVAIFGARMLRGEPCTIFGDGAQTRDFVYVGDLADAYARALDAGSGRVFNIGSGVETSVRELHETMAAAAGVANIPLFAPGRPGEAQRSCLDPAAARQGLGWHPVTSLHDGVTAVLDYWRSVA